MIEAIFEGARARCKAHPLHMLGPNEAECGECKTFQANMSLEPPFDVKCNRTHFEVKEGNIYKVFWIIRDGTKEEGKHISGYLFRSDKGDLVDRIYDPIEFTPVAFLDAVPPAERETDWLD